MEKSAIPKNVDAFLANLAKVSFESSESGTPMKYILANVSHGSETIDVILARDMRASGSLARKIEHQEIKVDFEKTAEELADPKLG